MVQCTIVASLSINGCTSILCTHPPTLSSTALQQCSNLALHFIVHCLCVANWNKLKVIVVVWKTNLWFDQRRKTLLIKPKDGNEVGHLSWLPLIFLLFSNRFYSDLYPCFETGVFTCKLSLNVSKRNLQIHLIEPCLYRLLFLGVAHNLCGTEQ